MWVVDHSKTWPSHIHLFLATCSLMVSIPVRLLISSFVTRIGQFIFNNRRRLLCKKVSTFFSSVLFILHVSHPYINTEMTLDLKMLILLVLLVNWLFFQILPNLYAALAFPNLALMSSSVPSDFLSFALKYTNRSTSSMSCPSTCTFSLLVLFNLRSWVFLRVNLQPSSLTVGAETSYFLLDLVSCAGDKCDVVCKIQVI